MADLESYTRGEPLSPGDSLESTAAYQRKDEQLLSIMESDAPVPSRDTLEAETPQTRALAAKRGWDKRGRGRHNRPKAGKQHATSKDALHFPRYQETPQGLKDEYNSLMGWQAAARERGLHVKLKSVGRHVHQYVAVDGAGKQVGHFNHDQTVAARHHGRLYT